MPIQDEIKDALATLAMPEAKLMIERADVPGRPLPKPTPNGTSGVHLGICNLTVKPGTALRYALELVNTAKAAMDRNIKAATLDRPVPEDLAPPEEPCCEKHRMSVEHTDGTDSLPAQATLTKEADMSVPEQYTRFARGVQLLSNVLNGEGPQSTRLAFDFTPQSLHEFAALQGHIEMRPREHPRELLQAFLHELQTELVGLAGGEELPPGPKAGPLMSLLQLRVAEWLGRAAPLVRTECDTAELTITLYNSQSYDTPRLEARLEEKTTHVEIRRMLPGIKSR